MLKVPALAKVTVPLAPPAIELVVVMVQTVLEVCATEIESILVKVKSTPFVVLMVEQSMVPVLAVMVNVLTFEVLVPEGVAKTKTGVVASMARLPVACNTAVDFESPVTWSPNSTV